MCSAPARPLFMCLLDPIINGLGIAGLHIQFFSNAFEHQFARRGGAQNINLLIHGCCNGRIVERRSKLLDITGVSIQQHNDQTSGHARAPSSIFAFIATPLLRS